MEWFVNACVIATTVFAFGYLCFVMLKPERF
jgi:K+-transporting ATPase KdpF subunit